MENNLEMKNSNDKGEQPQSESVNNDAEKQKGILSVLLKDTGVEKIILCKDASLMNLEVRITVILDNIFFSDESIEVMDDTSDDRPTWRRWLDQICGMPSKSHSQDDPHIGPEMTQKYLKESPKWKNVLNINAVVGLILTAFLYGFYH